MSAVVLLAAALAGRTGASDAYTRAFDRGFRESFRRTSVQGCVAGATGAAAAGYDMAPVGGCISDRLLATRTVAQLRETPAPEELRRLAAACLAERPPQRAGDRPATPR